jgi:hypothetical protein
MSQSKMQYKEFNDLVHRIKDDKKWFDEFISIVAEYYKSNPTGGSLHIVLDDGNLESSSIQWCAGYAYGLKDDVGNDIANLMRHMNIRQRKVVYDSGAY